jgi:4,5-dihydroxyphthalate decarboxylase
MGATTRRPVQPDRAASVVLADYRHTVQLKARTEIAGTPVTFPSVVPVWDAFDAMVQEQRYTFCELAVVAFLQAFDAGQPLRLLPISMVGGFHHRSTVVSPVDPPRGPADLAGRRVGVRSYSQTTAVWTRALLDEEYGLDAADVTWVVTEPSHSAGFVDPPNVETTTQSLDAALRSGSLAAAILGRQAAKDLAPLIPDAADGERRWFDRHGLVPINHMVVTTEREVAERPELVREVYQSVRSAIEDGQRSRPSSPDRLPTGTYADSGQVRAAVDLAAQYAFDQGLISAKPDTDRLFVPAECCDEVSGPI